MNRAIIFGFACFISSTSSAASYLFNWNPLLGGNSDNAGAVNHITASFNAVTNQLSYLVNVGAVPGAPNLKTDGFHVVFSPGPNPKGHSGELAIFYFDATVNGTPKLTAYNYNGFNANTSYKDGSNASGVQPPDKIKSSVNEPGWASFTVQDEANGSRTLGFTVDASVINSHVPLYPGPGSAAEWTGARFGANLGLWFHTYAGSSFTYQNGYIGTLSKQREGYVDGANFATVPEPTALAALLIAGGFLTVRRLRRI